jgi:hypothetical protein
MAWRAPSRNSEPAGVSAMCFCAFERKTSCTPILDSSCLSWMLSAGCESEHFSAASLRDLLPATHMKFRSSLVDSAGSLIGCLF